MVRPPPRVGRIFTELADTLADDFDIMDYLDNLACHGVSVTGVAACAVLLADPVGPLSMVAASSGPAHVLGTLQLRCQEGPALEAYQNRTPVSCADLAVAAERWPRFAPAAVAAGFAAVHAVPMRWRKQAVGALSLLDTAPAPLDVKAVSWGEDLADAATIGLMHRRTVRHQESVTQQLQRALNSRVLIEQAKGMLAERLNLTPDQAFVQLRAHARAHHLKLTAFSRAFIQGEIDIPVSGNGPDRPRLPS
ncbi:GAF and ANTAR domain-containing protein [Planobispora rosea]|uniref:GAF and ANTAR domain-containing protein n=1 Tax=Planobispora rosea TaxID=35762 RepID=UPI00083B0489|nr:GAF and ANTAR domain-containing protein [Planobispora rosea]